MAQPQQNIHIAAPGFAGLNTQDSPVGMDLSFASIAENCIIDRYGRIGARQGFQVVTANASAALGVNPLESAHEFVDLAGTPHLFGCGNNKIFTQTLPSGNLTQVVHSGITITANNWQMQGLDDRCYFVQQGYPIMEFLATTPTVIAPMAAQPLASIGTPSCITAGYGHLFVGGFTDNKSMIAYSTLSTGAPLDWTSPGAGAINLTQYWPDGVDEVVALKVHNDFLIIFGKRSILVYAIPDTGPDDITMTDTVSGIGCIARDSVKVIGTDVHFADASGIRSLQRTIQEKSMPLGEISMNVKKDITDLIYREDLDKIKAVFDQRNALYVVSFPVYSTSYVFDTRGTLENGAERTTTWPSKSIYCGASTAASDVYYGGKGGFYKYTGANDTAYITTGALPFGTPTYGGSVSIFPIQFKYYTQPQTFDSPANIKFPKQLDITIFGSTDFQLFTYWAFDYSNAFSSFEISRDGYMAAQYNLGYEYSTPLALYGNSVNELRQEKVNLWGSGRNIRFGFESPVTGTSFSIQELNIQALLGRIL